MQLMLLSRVGMLMDAGAISYTANPSVCLSVCPSHSGIVPKRMHTYRQTLSTVWSGHGTGFFERYRCCKIPRGTLSARALNTRRGEFCDFMTKKRRLSRKRYEIGSWLLWITNRKS